MNKLNISQKLSGCVSVTFDVSNTALKSSASFKHVTKDGNYN